jgi:hypothetical protein
MSTAAHLPRSGGLRAAWQEVLRRRRRRLLAQNFEAVLRDAREPRATWLSARVPVQRKQVLAAAEDIQRLIELLRDDDRPLRDDGLALARSLLIDSGSPVFEWTEPGTLRRRVRVVCEAVE